MILRWHPMIESIVELRDRGVAGRRIHTVEADFIFGELEGSEPDWARTAAHGGSLHLYAGLPCLRPAGVDHGDRISEISAVVRAPLRPVGIRRQRRAPWSGSPTAASAGRRSRWRRPRRTGSGSACSAHSGTSSTTPSCIPAEHGTSTSSTATGGSTSTYLPFDRVAADFLRTWPGGARLACVARRARPPCSRWRSMRQASAQERRIESRATPHYPC